jgi:hypothetical protein
MKPFLALLLIASSLTAEEPRSVSGIYPSLAMFNNEGECGTGAVVPWVDRLWVITYGPHLPHGSSDKLYEITPDLKQVVRPESTGGTHANRMIHQESQQLFIGSYAVDLDRKVRVIPFAKMPGRLTGTARHLTDPAGKVYIATMEEGLYEVDVMTLEPRWLIRDGNGPKKGVTDPSYIAGLDSQLPGYHGKGLHTGQGRLVYANNGDRDKRVLTDPTTPSGALGEWKPGQSDWVLVRRNQFTEVTGPGGIHGSADDAPLWSVGWDAKSLILMLLDDGKWQAFRLPKVSHSYDGAHGWNTEWPRIRDIGEDDLLMTMHGAFWRFPKAFSAAQPSGIRPRSAYLKVVGDFCRWGERLVFGCDDAAKSEFLNKRKVKGGIDSVGQSQSNLWFTAPETLDRLGSAHASGAVWLHDSVSEGSESDPFLVAGWKHRSLWFIDHSTGEAKRSTITETGDWLKVKAPAASSDFSAMITLTNGDDRGTEADPIFDGISRISDAQTQAGIFRPRGENKRSLGFVSDAGYYELDAKLNLKRVNDAGAESFTRKAVALPKDVITLDEASVLVVDDRGRRWRLPRASKDYDAATNNGELRICREVATERDMLSVSGTFFELPAENADGFAKIRPISSHDLRVIDFGSYRGLFLISGVKADAPAGEHILRSDDGKTALWAGVIDDLWKLGRPRGEGGPWKNTQAKAGQPSDPYLIWGYLDRSLTLGHRQSDPVKMRVELDLTGTGLWVLYEEVTVQANQPAQLSFPPALQARWLRVTTDQDCQATALLSYR